MSHIIIAGPVTSKVVDMVLEQSNPQNPELYWQKPVRIKTDNVPIVNGKKKDLFTPANSVLNKKLYNYFEDNEMIQKGTFVTDAVIVTVLQAILVCGCGGR